MAGSSFGKNFTVTTWGESHGPALGAVIDGVPAGVPLSDEDIQSFLDRRRPGTSSMTTARREGDQAEILSGVFEGRTLGTPVSIMVRNEDQHSKDYSDLRDVFRPGHADLTFQGKYGFRDHRGGGRSSGRETVGRVMAGAVASKILSELSISVSAYTKAIGPVVVKKLDLSETSQNPLFMPDRAQAEKAVRYVEQLSKKGDSCGGVVECVIKGLPVGIGEPVFDKLDARLSMALMSIGAVKGVEIGEGFKAAELTGSEDNDLFISDGIMIEKKTNHSGGTLGGMSDGADLIVRAAIKPTPSVSVEQDTVTSSFENTRISIKGRHDPVIVPRAVVVVESMAAVTVLDMLLSGMGSRMEDIGYYLSNIRERQKNQE